MTFEQFVRQVKEEILEYLPEKFSNGQVTVEDFVKSNDIRLKGLLIRTAESNATPTIYLEPFFERYQDGIDMDQVLDEISDQYMKYYIPQDLDLSNIVDFEQIKDKIICRLRGLKNNMEYLKGKPYKQVEDMAVIYHILFEKTDDGLYLSMPVTNQLLQRLGVDEESLYPLAIENTERFFPSEVKTMREVLLSLAPEGLLDEMQEIEAPEIYVLTNEDKLEGAVGILNPKIMDAIAEQIGSEVYVLPSSVHEVLLLKKEEGMDYHELDDMVKSVNATMYSEDILSDGVYEANLKEHRLIRCDRKEMQLIERMQQKRNLKEKSASINRNFKGPKI